MSAVRRKLWLVLLPLASIGVSLAHEGHVHPEASIPLWQIVIVIVGAVVTYLVVNALLRRRQRQSTTEISTNNDTDRRD